MARLVLHIGMGKTGTTSIQHALGASGARLRAQRARYLGMWFDPLGPAYAGYPGLIAISRAGEADKRRLAVTYAAALKTMARDEGIETFIHSNESIFERPRELAPFIETLGEHFDVRIVCFMRPVRDWLPSAYVQWGVRHKTQEGRVPAFDVMGEKLVGVYDAIHGWSERFPTAIDVRPFLKSSEVLETFEAACGIRLDRPETRHLERADPAEIVLRGLFNDRFAEPVLPAVFDRAVLAGARVPIPSVEAMAGKALSTPRLDEIIATKAATFEFIKARYGLDLMNDLASDPALEGGVSRERIVDVLVELLLAQSIRLTKLEELVAGMMSASPSEGHSEGHPK